MSDLMPENPTRGPRVRTLAEMRFFVSLERCRHCGEPVDPEPLEHAGDGDAYSMFGDCARCGGQLFFPFLTHGNPRLGAYTWDTLGQGASETIPPRKFIDEVLLLGTQIQPDPAALGVRAWEQNRDLSIRALISANELAKFLPDGADEIPPGDADERSHREQHPEPYRRKWIETACDHHRTLFDAYKAEIPRIDAEVARLKTAAPKGSVTYLDRDSLVAHEKWIAGGRRGKGQLVLFSAEHDAYKIGRGVEMSYATLVESKLPRAYLADVKLVGAEIIRSVLDRSDLYAALLHDATLDSSSLTYANLELAELHNAKVENSDFTGSALDQSEWKGAVAVGSTFADAQFLNANLDGATFRDCNLRGAAFAPADPDPPPTTRGARFENCDLRGTTWQGRDLSGAVFASCKLSGITGTPAAIDGIQILKPDLSEAGDGSKLGAADDVLALWGVSSPVHN